VTDNACPTDPIGRLPGWIAHWREMIDDPATKIGRPRQADIGDPERSYVPIGLRGGHDPHPRGPPETFTYLGLRFSRGFYDYP
jgi:hypothetical protein